MKNFFLFFTLFLILIAGCTQDTSASSNGGVITSARRGLTAVNFSSDFNTLRISEETVLKLLLENKGDFEATDIITVLYGEGLLERPNETNYTQSLTPDKQALHIWSLKVPLKLSQTESTNYNINARMYYNYEFSGFQQVGFVESDYVGGDLPLSSGVSTSPLNVNIDVRNPVRTLYDEGTIFTITSVVANNGYGNVDYFNCSALNTPPCRKEGYLNTFKLTIPNNWGEVTDMGAWKKSVDSENSEKTYTLDYDSLEASYDKLTKRYDLKEDDSNCVLKEEDFDCDNENICDGYDLFEDCFNDNKETFESSECDYYGLCEYEDCDFTLEEAYVNCYERYEDNYESICLQNPPHFDKECLRNHPDDYVEKCPYTGTECVSCKQREEYGWCNRVGEALNHLKMIRGREVRIILQFSKGQVNESTIDVIKVEGDFGYEVDTSDFTSPVRLRVIGD